VPAHAASIRLIRLTASGVASLAGLDVDGIDDVRIAVDEIGNALIESGDGSPVRVRFTWTGARLEIQGSTTRGTAELDRERFELSRDILRAVADDHQLDLSGPEVRLWLRKERLPALKAWG
jgi:hypothetical protein